jgi:hypothetical protein
MAARSPDNHEQSMAIAKKRPETIEPARQIPYNSTVTQLSAPLNFRLRLRKERAKIVFGYITTDPATLFAEDKKRYKAHYCGLCHQLSARHGSIGRAGLSCDMTFLSILLGSVYDLAEREGTVHCAANPVKWRPYTQTEATEYAADMNTILSYYQCLDDWKDESSLAALTRSKALKKHLPRILKAHPRQCAAIQSALDDIGEMERTDELNPDLPANCFGGLMASILVWREDEYAEILGALGASLGRFIYLMDAVNDLKDDIKKQRYNPLIAQLEADYTPMLTMIMGECAAVFERLPLKKDRHILENHIYAGVWQKYRMRAKEEGS